MLHKYKNPLIILTISAISLWIGSSLFSYFTYQQEPHFIVYGLEHNKSYKQIASGTINGDCGYKISHITAQLDNKPFYIDGTDSIKSKQFSIPIDIDTTKLTDGKHVLNLEATDASYNINKSTREIVFSVDNQPLKASFLQTGYKVDQGNTLHAQLQLNKQVQNAQISMMGKIFACYPEIESSTLYEAFIPIDCEDAPDEYIMNTQIIDKVGNTIKLANTATIKTVKFPKQKGFSVASEKLNEEKEISMNNKILSEALIKWSEDSPKQKLWKGRFEIPTVVQRITTPYGEIRVTPAKGRYLHKAIDIANSPQSVVWASQSGRVIIKDRYLMTGNTVIVDHGLGVFTHYCHLDDFADIEVGETIKKGQPIGKLGMTGYANGYHLHWELSINNQSVNPIEWTKKTF